MASLTKQKLSEYNNILTQVVAEVEFGAPSKDCRNFGICRINLLQNLESKKATTCIALLTFLKERDIEIIFLKSFLTEENRNKFFLKDFFIVEEDFNFHKLSTLPHFGAKDYKIKRGEYPIKETLGSYIVKF